MATVIRGDDNFDTSTDIAVPIFKAYKSSNQTVSANTYTKVTFETEEFDSNSFYNAATGRFQPTIAGYYNIGTCCAFLSGGFTAALSTLYKNGSQYAKLGYCYSATAGGLDDWAISAATLVHFNGSSDYCEIFAYVNGGGTTINGSSFAESTFFGHLVRRV